MAGLLLEPFTMKKYYKVVAVTKGNKRLVRHSVMKHRLYSKAVRYYPGRVATPKVAGSKLMAFDDRGDAFHFADRNMVRSGRRHEVWEVNVTNPQRINTIVFVREIGSASPAQIARWWQYLLTGKIYQLGVQDRNAPSGTVACDTVTLLRKVE